MATRCRVGILNEDLTVESFYVHWDGYPEHTGKLLHRHWRDTQKVRNLIRGGYLSSLDDALGEHGVPVERKPARPDKDEIYSHHPLNEWTPSGQEYEYIYNTGRGAWAVRGNLLDDPDSPWIDLEEVLGRKNVAEETKD